MKPSSAGAKGPDELRQQIQRTRAQLGDTVEELAGKTDVKGRARARAADLRDKAGAMTVQLRSSAAQAGHTVQGKATRASHTVQGKAARAGHAVQGGRRRKRERTGAAGGPDTAARGGSTLAEEITERTPGPVRRIAGAGRSRPRPVMMAGAAVAGAVLVAAVVLRRHEGRSRC